MALSRPLSRPLTRDANRTLTGGVDDFSLLQSYGGAAAAYSLQDINGTRGNVVRVRESIGNTEADMTAEQIANGHVRRFALQGDSKLWDFTNQTNGDTDKRMYFDGVNDAITVSGMVDSASYFGACTIQATAYIEDVS